MRCIAIMVLSGIYAETHGAYVECTEEVCFMALKAPFHHDLTLTMEKCDTRYQFEENALCSWTDIPAMDDTSIQSNVVLSVHLETSTFRIYARDYLANNYRASGSLRKWTPWGRPSREKLVGRRRLNFSLLKNIYMDDRLQFGLRRDCTKEHCPKRWKDCWPGKNSDDMIQLSVVVFLEKSFCDHFNKAGSRNVTRCLDYLDGVFLDTNLVYEQQLGVHLDLAHVIPPDVLTREFPQLATLPKNRSGHTYLNALSASWGGTGSCATSETFKRVTGFEYNAFSLAHTFTALNLAVTTQNRQSQGLGLAVPNSVCTCGATAWSTYMFDVSGSETWVTFAHEVGHNLGASHSFDEKAEDKTIPNRGIMGYALGKVDNVYAFHELNRANMCKKLTEVVTRHPGCFRPYKHVAEVDPRPDETPVAVLVITTFCIFVLSFVGIVAFAIHVRRR